MQDSKESVQKQGLKSYMIADRQSRMVADSFLEWERTKSRSKTDYNVMVDYCVELDILDGDPNSEESINKFL
jgi:hypothetical protein